MCLFKTVVLGYHSRCRMFTSMNVTKKEWVLGGELVVRRNGDLYEMDFPAYDLKEVAVTDAMAEAIGVRPVKAFMGRDLLCILEREEDVKNVVPDLEKLRVLTVFCFILRLKAKAMSVYREVLHRSWPCLEISYAAQGIVILFPTGQKRWVRPSLRLIRHHSVAVRFTAKLKAIELPCLERLACIRKGTYAFNN